MSKTIQYKKGAVIFFEGEKPCYILMLREGEVEISRFDNESKKFVYKTVKSGYFFSVKNKLMNMPYMSTAIATKDSVVTMFSKNEFEEFILCHNNLVLEIIKGLSGELKEIHAKLYAKYDYPREKNCERGMMRVARGFFDMQEYVTCVDVCNKFLEMNSKSNFKTKIEELLEDIDKIEKDETDKKSRQKKYKRIDVSDDKDVSVQDALSQRNVIFSEDDKVEIQLPESFKRYEKSFPAHKVIFSEFENGDSFFMVASGFVRSTKYINGTNVSISLAKPGEFFGLNYFVDMPIRDVTCVTSGDVKVLEFDRTYFETIITDNPKISLLLLKMLAKRVYLDRKILRNSYIADLQLRLKDMFSVLDENELCEKVGGSSRKINLTAKNISVWANVTEDAIQKQLDLLEFQKLIRQSDEGWILVRDIEGMKNISSGIRSA